MRAKESLNYYTHNIWHISMSGSKLADRRANNFQYLIVITDISKCAMQELSLRMIFSPIISLLIK